MFTRVGRRSCSVGQPEVGEVEPRRDQAAHERIGVVRNGALPDAGGDEYLRLCLDRTGVALDVDGGTSVRRFPDLTAMWQQRGLGESMAKQAQGILD